MDKEFKVGDVIAFGGFTPVSELIKFWTRSAVSHVAVVTGFIGGSPLIGESTSLSGFSGVVENFLFERLNKYAGNVWRLPLDRSLAPFNESKFRGFLDANIGKPYDKRQAVKSALDLTDSWQGPGYNEEDFEAFFCSELVAGLFQAAGFIDERVNCSEVTPIDLCRWRIYAGDQEQIKGEGQRIRRFNTANPLDWALD